VVIPKLVTAQELQTSRYDIIRLNLRLSSFLPISSAVHMVAAPSGAHLASASQPAPAQEPRQPVTAPAQPISNAAPSQAAVAVAVAATAALLK